jgi:hypothetical protein
MTVGKPALNGAAWVQRAKKDAPRTSEPRVTLIMTYTRRARWASGGLNMLTPLEMASTPVNEEPPLANERNTINSEAPSNSPLPG